MDNNLTTTIDDVKSVLSKESEVVLTELSRAACLANADDKHDAYQDAMNVADSYTKLFEAVSKVEQQRVDAEIKRQELELKVKEASENAVQSKRSAKVDTVKAIGDTVLKCGLLFAQGALYVWGINRTFDFEGFHTASTSVGRSLLNNVSSLFIKK